MWGSVKSKSCFRKLFSLSFPQDRRLLIETRVEALNHWLVFGNKHWYKFFVVSRE